MSIDLNEVTAEKMRELSHKSQEDPLDSLEHVLTKIKDLAGTGEICLTMEDKCLTSREREFLIKLGYKLSVQEVFVEGGYYICDVIGWGVAREINEN